MEKSEKYYGKYSNTFRIVVSIALIAVIGILLWYLLSDKKDDSKVYYGDVFNRNVQTMKEASLSYFTVDRLPQETSKSETITLQEMINNKMILPFKDRNDESCDLNNSYATVTKLLNDEYSLKVQLICGEESDYILYTIGCHDVCNVVDDEDKCPTQNCEDPKPTPTPTPKPTPKPDPEPKTDPEPVKYYKVKFYANGGSETATQTVQEKGYAEKPANPTRTGYTFLGWTTKLNGKHYFDFANTKITKNITLYAKWEQKKAEMVTVTFDSNGGSYVPKDIIKINTSVNEPKAPTRIGHIFLGWTETKDGDDFYDFSRAVPEDKTLYAKWEKVETNVYIVTFNGNGGSSTPTQNVEENKTAAQPADPTRAGYAFLGWTTTRDGNDYYNFNTPVTKNITLYAKWSKVEVNIYRVIFNGNGGSATPTQNVEENKTAIPPANPTRSGYTFLGWTKTLNGSDYYSFSTPVTADITLYAKWTTSVSPQTYKVIFDGNGGTSLATKYVDANTRVQEPNTIPVRSGYTFLGWTTTRNGNTYYNFNNLVTSDITLYAKWESTSKTLWCTFVKLDYDEKGPYDGRCGSKSDCREVKDTEKRYEYEEKRKNVYDYVYTTSYVSESAIKPGFSYSYTLEFTKNSIPSDAKNVNITGYNFSSDSDYRNYINGGNSSITMLNVDNTLKVAIGNDTTRYRNGSLKSGDFSYSVGTPYKTSSGTYRATVNISVYRYTDMNPFWASNLGKYVYLVPLKLKVSYDTITTERVLVEETVYKHYIKKYYQNWNYTKTAKATDKINNYEKTSDCWYQ